MTVGRGGGRLPEAPGMHSPSETPGFLESGCLIRNHLARRSSFPDFRGWLRESREELGDIGGARVRAAPRSAEVAPVRTVPVPVRLFGNLAASRILDSASAQPQ